MSKSHYDVCVVGAGPSGLSLACHCAANGLKTLCIAPDIEELWENNYGVWADEVEHLGLAKAFRSYWPKTRVVFSEESAKVLPRGYGQFDRRRLRQTLLDQADPALLNLEKGLVVGCDHMPTYSMVYVAGGRSYETRVVVDASGFKPVLLKRPGKNPDVLQVAYGALMEVESHPYALDTMVLMDFQAGFLPKGHRPPTFVYVMPFSKNQLFMEETVVLKRGGASMEMLNQRLGQRLRTYGIRPLTTTWEEFCYIPMNPRLPDFSQRTLGVGAAAGFVHPGTGYSVSLSLNRAPQVAAKLAKLLGAPGNDLDQVAREAWKTVWPLDRRLQRIIYRFGMEMFNVMDVHVLSGFLKVFFHLPPAFAKGYLSADIGPQNMLSGLLNVAPKK